MKMRFIIIYLLVSLVCFGICEKIEINIDQGRLLGRTDNTWKGRKYYRFTGIPYAESPIGELRLEPPVPHRGWKNVFDVTQDGASCLQYGMGYSEGQEDCLILNVFTPKLPSDKNFKNLPVLVWLHGGAFVVGSANEYNPTIIMDKDVVLVMPNYRLGMMGFSYTRTSITSGNMGLLDQHMALKWVKKNIASFGGDPERITLGGDCAGGSSALLHMMSPMSKDQDLFHQVISFSGSPLNPWSVRPTHKRLEMMISNKVGCPHFSPFIFKKCMKEKSIETIMETARDFIEAMDLLVGNADFAPVYQEEPWMNGTKPFLQAHPYHLLSTGKLIKKPVLLSVTKDIGSYMVDMVLYNYIKMKLEDDSNYMRELWPMLVMESRFHHMWKGTDQMLDYYVPNWKNRDLEELVSDMAVMLGDFQYTAGIFATAKLLSLKKVPTKLFRFDYMGGPKFFDQRHPNKSSAPPLPEAVSLGDDLFFFLPNTKHFNPNVDQAKVIDIVSDMVYNFVAGSLDDKEFPIFDVDSISTNAVSEDGELMRGIRFTERSREQKLFEIFEAQHEKYKTNLEEQKKGKEEL